MCALRLPVSDQVMLCRDDGKLDGTECSNSTSGSSRGDKESPAPECLQSSDSGSSNVADARFELRDVATAPRVESPPHSLQESRLDAQTAKYLMTEDAASRLGCPGNVSDLSLATGLRCL